VGILRKNHFWLSAITGIILLTYLGSFRVPLLFDDLITLKDNPTIRSLSDLRHILGFPDGIVLSWRPFSNLSFAVSYALSGLNPWGHHLIGIFVQIITSCVLFLLLKKTFELPSLKKYNSDAFIIAGTITLLWAIHPAQTQSVTYISQRMECLMGLFYLLTIYCFSKATTVKSWGYYSLATLACFLGALSKEVIITAPIIILIYDAIFICGSYKKAVKEHGLQLGLIALNGIVIVILAKSLKVQSVGFTTTVSPWTYALTETKAIYTYVTLSVWPHPLIFNRGPVFIKDSIEALPYITVTLLVIAFSSWALVNKPKLGFLGAWFFIILSPTTSFIPIAKEPIAENRLYLPLISICTLVILGLWHFTSKRIFYIITSVLILVCVGLSISRICQYETGFSIWRDTVSKAPENPGAHINLGNMWDKEKHNTDEAIHEYRTALALDPLNPEANSNLANLITQTPHHEEQAIKLYEIALKANPDFAEIHNNIAHLLEKNPSKIKEAILHYKQALLLKPSDAEIHRNYAELLSKDISKRFEAIKEYELANTLEPDNILCLNNLAVLLTQTEDRKNEAVAYFKHALILNPNAAETHFNLANTYSALGKMDNEAITQYLEAIQINPNYPESHFNLANILSTIPGHTSEAIAHYRSAIAHKYNYIEAHNNLAILLSSLSNGHEEAVHEYELALSLAPQSYLIEYNLAAELMKKQETQKLGINHLQHTVILNPTFTPALDALRILKLSQGIKP
jgi:tetratricopeptide (TPR) repeat protein